MSEIVWPWPNLSWSWYLFCSIYSPGRLHNMLAQGLARWGYRYIDQSDWCGLPIEHFLLAETLPLQSWQTDHTGTGKGHARTLAHFSRRCDMTLSLPLPSPALSLFLYLFLSHSLSLSLSHSLTHYYACMLKLKFFFLRFLISAWYIAVVFRIFKSCPIMAPISA